MSNLPAWRDHWSDIVHAQGTSSTRFVDANLAMDRTDRTLTASSQAGLRGFPENGPQGRRPVPNSAATSNGPPPPPPIPNLRKIPSNSNLSASAGMSAAQVIVLARESMRSALESETQAAQASGLKTGVTIDLSRKNIQKLPEEVVDIVKNELERSVAVILGDAQSRTRC